MKATLFVGWYRTTECEIDITKEDVMNGYCQICCGECDGTGIFMVPDGVIGTTYQWPHNPCPEKPTQCVDCKGTGKIYINV